MEYVKPTYEEYCKASEFAKIRYKYGLYIQTLATILLLILIIYTAFNIEEMKANPVDYAEEKLDVICHSTMSLQLTNYRSVENITDIRKRR